MLRAALIAAIAMLAAAGGPAAAQGAAGGREACGFAPYQPCHIVNDACVLLSPAVLGSVVGPGWTRQGSGPMRPVPGADLINHCMYDGPHEDEDATLAMRPGGRAKFTETVRDFRHGLKKVSGVGDDAYEFVFPGSPANGIELWVIKGGTYFDLKVYSADPNLPRWGVALARMVAARIK